MGLNGVYIVIDIYGIIRYDLWAVIQLIDHAAVAQECRRQRRLMTLEHNKF